MYRTYKIYHKFLLSSLPDEAHVDSRKSFPRPAINSYNRIRVSLQSKRERSRRESPSVKRQDVSWLHTIFQVPGFWAQQIDHGADTSCGIKERSFFYVTTKYWGTSKSLHKIGINVYEMWEILVYFFVTVITCWLFEVIYFTTNSKDVAAVKYSVIQLVQTG